MQEHVMALKCEHTHSSSGGLVVRSFSICFQALVFSTPEFAVVDL